MKVCIFGAGIGGLTVAHELSKFNHHDIVMYEKNMEVGGLARSMRDSDGCATEICWRVFFGFYDNLFKTFSEIGILDSFTKYKHMNITDSENHMFDKITVMWNILYGLTSCDKRLDQMDQIPWYKGVGLVAETNLMRAIGPWLGMDRYKGSYKSVIKVGMEMQILETLTNSKYMDYVTTGPTSEIVFDPWVRYLKKRGVKINLGHALHRVNIIDGLIQDVVVYDANENKYVNVKADQYVFNLPVDVLDKIIDNTHGLNQGDFGNIKTLANTCTHNQISFQVFFNKEIMLGNENAFLIEDSPWDLIVLSYNQVYRTDLCTDIMVKGGWSVAVCTSYVNGIIFGKPFDQCTYDEIIIESWEQIKRSKMLQRIIREQNGFDLTDNLVVKWSKMWNTWSFINNRWHTTEPKFTNNAGSWAIRPSYKTHIKNLYLSTAYVKETIDIFSMEAANIAGKYVANAINDEIARPSVRARPVMFNIFREIDNANYLLGLPNLSVLLIIAVIIMVIWSVYFSI